MSASASTLIRRSSRTMAAAVLIMTSFTAVAGAPEPPCFLIESRPSLNCLNHRKAVDCGRTSSPYACCNISYAYVADFCRQTQNFKAKYCSPRTDSISHMQLQTTRAFTAHCFWTHARTRFLGCVRIPLEPVFTLQLVSSPFVQCVLQNKFILTRF